MADNQPLGPLDSAKITDPDVFSILFSEHVKTYTFLNKSPSIIYGRRGSGKTGYLKHLEEKSKDNDIIIDVPFEDIFNKISSVCANHIKADYPAFAEYVEKHWDLYILFSILDKLKYDFRTKSTSSNIIDSLIDRVLRILNESHKSLAAIAYEARSMDNSLANAVASITSYVVGDVSQNVRYFRESVLTTLNDFNVRAYILIDSKDQYDLENQGSLLALQGLTKCVSKYNINNSPIEIRLCLPDELDKDVITTNRLKDLDNSATLRWTATDLSLLLARRYYCFLVVNNHLIEAPSEENLMKELKRLEYPAYALEFLDRTFGLNLQNAYGFDERGLLYILRHTQMLPRQLIYLANEIIKLAPRDMQKVDPEVIKEAMQNVEDPLSGEICQSYYFLQTDVKEVANLLRADIDRIFNMEHFAEKIQKFKNNGGLRKSDMSPYDALKMLINIGAVGNVIREDKQYVIGRFNYNNAGSVSISEKVKYCSHPLFSGRTIENRSTVRLNGKPIMPESSAP